MGRCNLNETMIKKMAFGIFSPGDLIQSGWIAELRTQVKYGIYNVEQRMFFDIQTDLMSSSDR